MNVELFKETGKLAERYDVVNKNMNGSKFSSTAGYGWTNGVLLRLLEDGE